MSDVLAIRANNNGCLKLSINTEGVKVDTEWKDCTNPKSEFFGFPSVYVSLICYFYPAQDADGVDTPDPEELFAVLVSVRSFLKFLNCHVVSTTTIACSYFYPDCTLQNYNLIILL
jgi:HUS1 checkpoint protein